MSLNLSLAAAILNFQPLSVEMAQTLMGWIGTERTFERGRESKRKVEIDLEDSVTSVRNNSDPNEIQNIQELNFSKKNS